MRCRAIINKFKARINDQIREDEVRVIDVDGKQLGIMKTRDAVKLAQEKELDLVEISKGEGHSICKIVDYGKYKYEKERMEKENRKKQKNVTLKEIKITPNIGAHDLEIKKKKIVELLEDENKVKVLLVLRGREKLYADRGIEVLNKLAEGLEEVSSIEKNYTLQKHLLLSPKKK